MSATTSSIKSAGIVAFFAMVAIGWQLAAPSAPAETAVPQPVKSRTVRAERKPRISPAEVIAKRRMGSLRATADPGMRMLAAIALAESLSAADFSEWLENGWFNIRGGPELMIFTQILTKRWRSEDPEGYVAWAAKNGMGEADTLMNEWAAKDPRRLIDYFKTHRNDGKELQMLTKMSATSPDLVFQRLREMAEAGDPALKSGGALELVMTLAAKSPAALAAMLDSLPLEVRRMAETQLTTDRLKASFSDEIHKLWDRPDGWETFSFCAHLDEISSNLVDELGNLPPDWLRGIGMNPGRVITPKTARQWLDIDLQGVGFSTAEIKFIQGNALKEMVDGNPEKAVERLGDLDISARLRKEILARAFSYGDIEKLRALADQLPIEEERNAANAQLDRRTAPAEDKKVVGSEDSLANLVGDDSAKGVSLKSLTAARSWDAEKIATVTTNFQALPDDRKRAVADAICDDRLFSLMPQSLRSEAIRCLVENPGPPDKTSGSKSATFISSEFAVELSDKDPSAATAWVESLPAGEARDWSRKNLIDNWKQYDPQAAAAWEKSLPAADRATLAELRKKSNR